LHLFILTVLCWKCDTFSWKTSVFVLVNQVLCTFKVPVATSKTLFSLPSIPSLCVQWYDVHGILYRHSVWGMLYRHHVPPLYEFYQLFSCTSVLPLRPRPPVRLLPIRPIRPPISCTTVTYRRTPTLSCTVSCKFCLLLIDKGYVRGHGYPVIRGKLHQD
jgi:hypothetical protein